MLSPEKIIIVPDKSELPISQRPEFKQGSRVLAIYPNTTVFYTAKVHAGPRRNKNNKYTLEFRDDNDELREIDAYQVVPLPAQFYE